MFDDDRPKPKPPVHEIGQPLDRLSIAEIDARVAILKDEIARLEAAKAAKGSVRDAAESLFRR